MTRYKQIALTTVLLSLNTFAFSDDNRSENKKNQQTPPGVLGDMLPPYVNPDRFMIQGSFIFWAADVDGIDGSLEGITTKSVTQNNSQSPSYQMRRKAPGFIHGDIRRKSDLFSIEIRRF